MVRFLSSPGYPPGAYPPCNNPGRDQDGLNTKKAFPYMSCHLAPTARQVVFAAGSSMKASSTIALGTGQAKTSRLDRTPCHTCRLKRLRCDGGEPRCNKCAVRGVECLGYGERPFRWVLQQSLGPPPPEGATTSEQHHGRAVRRPMIEGAQRKRGRPKLVLMSHDDQRDRTELQLCVVQKQGRMPFPGAKLDPVEYQHHRRILSSLDYCAS